MKSDNFETPRSFAGATVYNVTSVRGGDCFLFVYDDLTFLFESGYGFGCEEQYENIKAVLGDRNLDYILLSHSHYDHCAGSAYLKLMYPEMKVVAFSYAAKIMAKESARTVMRRLNLAASKFKGYESFTDYFDHLAVDISVEEGDVIDLNGHKAQIISLPGHTKDSIGYYFMNEKMMLGCETIGMYAKDDIVMPSFLVGYQMSLDSIKRASTFDLDYYIIPHWGLLEGDNIKTFFEDSYKSHIYGHDLIVNAYKECKTMKEIYNLFQEAYYSDEVKDMYPPAAFEENVTIQIPLILKEDGYFPDEEALKNFLATYKS